MVQSTVQAKQEKRQSLQSQKVSQQQAQQIKIQDNRQSTLQLKVEQIHEQKQEPVKQRNNTGLPDNLKSGMENLSGMSLDHVNVHYNSPKPAAVQAHAYAQGSDIHLASGQEQHLPHELGHVVQQAQGRVQATTSVGGMAVNDNDGLEHEATAMGNKALQLAAKSKPNIAEKPVQRMEEEEELLQGKFTTASLTQKS